ncbi:hypothetical protein K1719_012205 [Acacia pycnantha]|nr:hypothetical protein K1719_012205 [Acacia pycnantha]
MACPGEGILTDLNRRLVDKAIKEVSYFRRFETHDRKFKQALQLLEIKLEEVQKDIEDAKRNNQYQIKREVQAWIREADNLIQNKAEIRSTRFDSWCLLRQYRQGKRLAQRRLTIQEQNEKCKFEVVARPAELLYMKYHASRDFIDFESRKTKLKQLVEALEDGNHYMIGLQGMGGTGKTTLATQVGKQVEESKAFEKVIFVVVSNSPDVNKIRGDIARQLGLRLKESEEADHSKLLWSRISNNEKRVLIILDDVWGELNLTEIGIPSGLDHKNCYVLITTRHSKVCQAMRCQQIVHLHTLDDDDALHLFLFHATSDDDDSSTNELKGLAREFLKECGGLPVAIVALASTLRNWHVGELKVALTALQNSKPFVDVDEDLVKVYICLRLSYDNLYNEKAQQLFLLCSIFPEDYEFPIDLIIRLGIGSGIFVEAVDYCAARSQALAVKNKLVDSSLLQQVGEKECVKMHDLVRGVAQWIAKEDIQVIKDSRTTLKTNKRFVFWSTDDFPDQFDDTRLEILLLWISGNVRVKDPNAFFARMSKLKILFLLGEYGRRVSSPLLLKSLLSLKDIHTLILDGWELGDISILKNIQNLVTLEFKNCLIIELPRNIMELKKLRWFGMRMCEIQKNNPFKVIEKCSQLEEVHFVENFNIEDWNTEDDREIEDIAQDISPAKFQIFSIADDDFKRFAGDYNGLLKCFKSEHIEHLIPDSMFEYLNVPRPPQVFKEDSKEKHENSKASAFSWAYGCCFMAPTKDTNIGVSNATKEHHTISQGSCGSIKRMETLHTPECLMRHPLRLQNIKEMRLWGCSKLKSLFSVSIATTIMLETLHISECEELKHIIINEAEDDDHITCTSIFPNLQSLTAPTKDTNIGVPNATVKHHTISQGSCGSSKRMETVHTLECLMRHPFSQQNIREMRLVRCSKLKLLFSVSIVTTMTMLEELCIEECEELKHIITNEAEDDDHHCTSIFPSLQRLKVSLKCLFSISTCGMFPKLVSLKIKEVSELEQVFIHKQDDMQKMTMMGEVFPKLSNVTLRKLPMLVTICEGIDFQNVRCSVNDCPKYQGINDIQEELEDGDSENQARRNVSPDFVESSKETMTANVEEVASSFELEDEPETSESIMQLQQEDLVKTKTIKASHKTNIPFHDNSIDVILKERAEEGSTSEDVVAATMVTDLAPRNSWSVTSSVVSQVEGSKSGPTLVTQGIKDTMEQGLKDNYPEDDAMISVRSTNSYSRKRSTVGPIDNLSRKDSAMSAKEKAKGVHEKATATCTLPMATPFESEFVRALTVEEAGDHSNVQKEAELEKPIKAILPQVIPSLHYQSQYVDVGSSSLKLGICEIFRLVELKHGETALLAQALEQYPQLLLPRANRTDRIIALSYRVLVDILVMLDTKTPNTITQSEKSTLEANLSDAIFLGFDKDWVESIRAKVLGVDMSDILAAKRKSK